MDLWPFLIAARVGFSSARRRAGAARGRRWAAARRLGGPLWGFTGHSVTVRGSGCSTAGRRAVAGFGLPRRRPLAAPRPRQACPWHVLHATQGPSGSGARLAPHHAARNPNDRDRLHVASLPFPAARRERHHPGSDGRRPPARPSVSHLVRAFGCGTPLGRFIPHGGGRAPIREIPHHRDPLILVQPRQTGVSTRENHRSRPGDRNP